MPDDSGFAMPAGSEPPGPTYYGQPQLKPSPFGWKVSLYIWLAGLSGSSQLLATVADLFGARRTRGMVRRGRYLAMVGAILGPILLIADLLTPQRFYNMLRIFKPTSPMSIGAYILSAFSIFSGVTAGAQFLADRVLRAPLHWLRTLARATQIPAALTGSGMSVYTAALQSATSTPVWAASPRSLAIRYGSSSVASAAAALSLAERAWGNSRTARRLDEVAAVALVVELGATLAAAREYKEKGVAEVLDSGAIGAAESFGVVGLGTVLPLGLYAASLLWGREARPLSGSASLATLAGGLALRHVTMVAGNESARRPEIGFAHAQPRNLPRT